jgi:hypothetical protein
MSVRAKFKLISVEASILSTSEKVVKDDGNGKASVEYVPVDKEMRTLNFIPVYGNGDPSHENTKFWQASPSGSIKLGTVNPEAWEKFELNKEYYIDFTPAD